MAKYLAKRELAKKLVGTFKAETGTKVTIDNMVKLLSILADTITQEIINGENVRLNNLVDFIGKDQEEKTRKNPKTQEDVVVPAKKVVQIKKSRKFSESVAAGEIVAVAETSDEE